MRYAYAITGILLAGGAAATLAIQQPVGAQVAQNAPTVMPPAGAPSSFADLTERLAPAVVNISTTQTIEVNRRNPFAGSPFDDFFRQFGPQNNRNSNEPITRQATSLGSGFIISADGYVVTNNHVISARGANGQPGTDAVDTITVTLSDRTEYEARVVGRDAASDLAVLKIDGTDLPFVQFGDSDSLRVGDWVIAIGNPFGLGGTVTAGIVSALQRSIGQLGAYDRYIQTDASINQGNSGGPMFDLQGNVVGINSAIFSPTGGNVGIGFAIPAHEAWPIVQTLMRGERVQRGYLGVSIQPMSDDIADSLGLPHNRGEIVARVEPGEAAERSGIRQGDVIVSVNGRDVTPDETLSYIVANLPVGERVPIVLIRDGERVRVTATMGERPTDEELLERAQQGQGDEQSATPDKDDENSEDVQETMDLIGLGFQSLNPEIARQLGIRSSVRGLAVGQVDPSSDAAQKGIRRGDVVLSINRSATAQPSDAVRIIENARRAGRSTVLLLIQRGNNPPRYIGVDILAE
ncbi:Do family serine endopeptidase [Parasphingopyxis marina]|uniref:Probable periplasmic serine endoprotease DegP-like n=1 Tax=Parasphingopyxis marina TaxID=2761622 RepID=A0A842I3G3_9SPHN|nr:Do family serine endopeptidase [Parasphingopyxis marina]MBC2778534.1 Do family serine endopeptidase [Parasphingopyxis marina]